MLKRIAFLMCILSGLLISSVKGKNSGIVEASYKIIPQPHQVVSHSAEKPFVLTASSRIYYKEKSLVNEAIALAHYIKRLNGLDLSVRLDNSTGIRQNYIELKINKSVGNPEGYKLHVYSGGVVIEGGSEAGVFYGVQSLRKALPAVVCRAVSLPAVDITDSPRFPYRGMMLDVSRHFSSTADVKRFLDILALHNVNYFHWHLTDDQGWRIEIKSRPKLVQIGSKRAGTVVGHNLEGQYDGKPYGGYYTQEEIKEIVAYAKKLHITVIPEIDMPGHMLAALASYPELGCTGGPYSVWQKWGVSKDVLCAGNDAAYRFIEDVLREIVALFPSPYIHLGGDECPKDRWKTCSKCRAKIKVLGLKQEGKFSAEDMLQNFMVKYAVDFLAKYKRRVIGWDEILDGKIIPGTTVMSWRGEAGGITAASLKHNVIMTPMQYAYFDFYQSTDVEQEPLAIGNYLPVGKVYQYEPLHNISRAYIPYVQGVQANLWREYIPTLEQTEYMLLPRLAALSEVQWSRPERKDYNSFLVRMERLTDHYDSFGYRYAKTLYEVSDTVTFDRDKQALQVRLATPYKNAPVYYTLDGTLPTLASPVYTTPFYVKENTVVKAFAVHPKGNSRVFTDSLVVTKSTGKSVKLLQPANPEFTFGGAPLLTDGLKGNSCYSTGRWLGCYGNDLEVVIDLERPEEVHQLSFATCVLQSTGVFEMRGVEVAVSDDGQSFRSVTVTNCSEMPVDYSDGVHHHVVTFSPVKARFIKVKVRSEPKLPAWHDAKGTPGYLFVDELGVL